MPRHDDLRERQGQQSLGPRPRGDPFVGIHAGQRQPRADVHELGHRRGPAGIERVRAREAVLEFDGGEPGIEEVRTEGEDVLCIPEVVGGYTGGAERHAVAGAERFEGERLVAHAPAADLLHPLVHQIAERRLLGAAQEHDAFALRLADLRRESLDGAVPIDVFENAAGVADHRMRNAIRIVEALQRRLPAGAQPAAIDRRIGIPLQLHRAAFTDTHPDAAARRALATCRGVVGRGARNLILGLDEVGDQAFGRLGPDPARRRGGGPGPGDAKHLQKAATIDGKRVTHISNGTRYNRALRCF